MIGAIVRWSVTEVASSQDPQAELVPAAAARDYLRLSTNDDDALLTALSKAARRNLEMYSRHVGLRRQFDMTLDSIPPCGVIELPFMPVSAVASITSYDRDNVAAVMGSSGYYLDLSGRPARIMLNDGASWPSSLRDMAGLVVRFTAGFSTQAAGVPEEFTAAIKQYVAALYEHRGEGVDEHCVPPMVRELMGPYWLADAG